MSRSYGWHALIFALLFAMVYTKKVKICGKKIMKYELSRHAQLGNKNCVLFYLQNEIDFLLERKAFYDANLKTVAFLARLEHMYVFCAPKAEHFNKFETVEQAQVAYAMQYVQNFVAKTAGLNFKAFHAKNKNSLIDVYPTFNAYKSKAAKKDTLKATFLKSTAIKCRNFYALLPVMLLAF